MHIFIYFHSRLPTSLDIFEDMLEECLDSDGEVTGSGTGQTGSNIDIEVFDDEATGVIGRIKATLKDAAAPMDTVMVVGDERLNVYD
jgi:hypothetical protein